MTCQTSVTIHAKLVGRTWAGYEGWQSVTLDLAEMRRRAGEDTPFPQLVDLALSEKDGDFQGAKLADGYVRIAMLCQHGRTTTTRSKLYGIEEFPSIADYVETDWPGAPNEDD
jgi:hypothetical protein